MQHKIKTMFRQGVQDFLKATKPSKCLLAYHSVSIGQFLFQNIGVEVDMTAGAFVVVEMQRVHYFYKIVFPQVGKRSYRQGFSPQLHVGQVIISIK